MATRARGKYKFVPLLIRVLNENRDMDFKKLSEQEESIGKSIVNAAYTVHSGLGSGLLEKVYEVCLTHELRKSGLLVARQVEISITYDGIVFDEGLRLDLLVENKVVV